MGHCYRRSEKFRGGALADADQIAGFLASAGWAGATRSNLAGDASNRSYDRLALGAERRVLMIAPPEKGEDTGPFARVTGILRMGGLSAPEIYARDADLGLMLIEDLGDDLFARLAGDLDLEQQIYHAAVDVLGDVAELGVQPGIGAYDVATYQREARLILDWYIPAVVGKGVSAAAEEEFLSLIEGACGDARQDTLVLRDYHAENLLWLPDREGTARVGLIDYQDALMGDAVYDLVSLTEDARRDVAKPLQEALKRHFLEVSGYYQGHFENVYHALGAHRNIKIVGIFARLCIRDGKASYPDMIPRVWGHLKRDLAHPKLTALKAWIDRHVPAPDAAAIQAIKDQCRAR